MQLNEVLKKVWQAIPNVKALSIVVEKPLNSGVKLTAVADTGSGGQRIILPHAIEFARSLNSYESVEPWNRMTIVMRSRNTVEISASFDQELYQATLDRIK